MDLEFLEDEVRTILHSHGKVRHLLGAMVDLMDSDYYDEALEIAYKCRDLNLTGSQGEFLTKALFDAGLTLSSNVECLETGLKYFRHAFDAAGEYKQVQIRRVSLIWLTEIYARIGNWKMSVYCCELLNEEDTQPFWKSLHLLRAARQLKEGDCVFRSRFEACKDAFTDVLQFKNLLVEVMGNGGGEREDRVVDELFKLAERRFVLDDKASEEILCNRLLYLLERRYSPEDAFAVLKRYNERFGQALSSADLPANYHRILDFCDHFTESLMTLRDFSEAQRWTSALFFLSHADKNNFVARMRFLVRLILCTMNLEGYDTAQALLASHITLNPNYAFLHRLRLQLAVLPKRFDCHQGGVKGSEGFRGHSGG